MHADAGQRLSAARLSTTGRAAKLAVDSAGSKVYWVNAALTPPAIQRANFDGTGIETLAATVATGANPVVVSNDYIQEVAVGVTTPAQLVPWATNLTAITLGGCAP